jgi:hypothetical protein
MYTETNTTIFNSTFYNNSALTGGGAIMLNGENAILLGNNFTSCSAQQANGTKEKKGKEKEGRRNEGSKEKKKKKLRTKGTNSFS